MAVTLAVLKVEQLALRSVDVSVPRRASYSVVWKDLQMVVWTVVRKASVRADSLVLLMA